MVRAWQSIQVDMAAYDSQWQVSPAPSLSLSLSPLSPSLII